MDPLPIKSRYTKNLQDYIDDLNKVARMVLKVL